MPTSHNEPRELVLLSKAERILAEAKTVDDVKDLRDKAAAVQAYARKAKLGQKLLVEAAVVKLRAERRLGEMLASLDLADSALGNQYTGPVDEPLVENAPVRLRDLGITKSDSSRTQRIAALPDEVFEQYIADNLEVQREPTTAGLLRLVNTTASPPGESHQITIHSYGHSPFAELIETGRKFATIYADLPWPAANGPDCRRSAAVFAAEPLALVCDQNAHLHLWATTETLPYSFQIIQAWGFVYRSCLVCLDTTIRGTVYWCEAQQFLLLGVRGDLPFSGPEQPGWTKFDWPDDGTKPDAVRELIEIVSPGPYLDLFGTVRDPGHKWVVLSRPSSRNARKSIDNAEPDTDPSTDP